MNTSKYYISNADEIRNSTIDSLKNEVLPIYLLKNINNTKVYNILAEAKKHPNYKKRARRAKIRVEISDWLYRLSKKIGGWHE